MTGIEHVTLPGNHLGSALAAGPTTDHRGLVLLLHGFPDNAHSFRHQLSALGDAGYRAIAPTMRGYEPSSQPSDGDYSLTTLATDVVAWLEELEQPTAHLVGHDWGAAVAYVAGARHGDRLTTVTAMAIPSLSRIPTAIPRVPRQLARSWYMTWFQLRGVADWSITVGDHRLLRRLWQSWSPGLDLDDVDWDAVCATFDAPGVVSAALGYYRQNATPPILLGLRATEAMQASIVPVPTLIINGADDGCMDRRLYAHTITEADYPAGVAHIELDNAGHFLHLERPADITRLLLDHFATSP